MRRNGEVMAMWGLYSLLGLLVAWCLIFGAIWIGDYLRRLDR